MEPRDPRGPGQQGLKGKHAAPMGMMLLWCLPMFLNTSWTLLYQHTQQEARQWRISLLKLVWAIILGSRKGPLETISFTQPCKPMVLARLGNSCWQTVQGYTLCLVWAWSGLPLDLLWACCGLVWAWSGLGLGLFCGCPGLGLGLPWA